ncbi:undecaprenyl-diphosphate phosphatase [Candidatus Riflebacteria bacterium]
MEVNTFKVIFLAFVQGLGEFFPISSSGHLVITQYYLGLKGDMLSLDILLHAGTLLALLIFFSQEIMNIFKHLLTTPWRKWWKHPNGSIFLFILLACIPTGIIGLLGKNFFEKMFHSTSWATIGFLLTGNILLLCNFWNFKQLSETDLIQSGNKNALIVGTIQGFSIIPGISRSGSTISCLYALGYNLKEAGKISFLLSIPAVLGAVLLQSPKLLVTGIQGLSLIQAILGFSISFITGYLVLKILMRMLSSGKNFFRFGYYCCFLGLFLTFFEAIYGN